MIGRNSLDLYNMPVQPTQWVVKGVIPRGARCHLCGRLGADTLDHIVPLAAGGANEPGNWAPAHRSCNASKGSG